MKQGRSVNAILFGLLGFALVLSFTLTGCRPNFPECDTDEDCKDATEQNQGKYLYCVNKTCQECRDANDCSNGWLCKNNRCEPECRSNVDCRNGLVCKNYLCKPECTIDTDCAPGNKCENQRCVPALECTSDADCAEGKRCAGGKCIEAPVAQQRKCELETIHFDFDKYDIRSDAREILDANVKCIKSRTEIRKITIEGNCDERGTTEYNLALGEKRANAAKKYLINSGIKGDMLKTVSYGEERPVDSGSNEDAWAKNRRDDFTIEE